MMDPLRPIAPIERELDPILRVERTGRERDRDAERERRGRHRPAGRVEPPVEEPQAETPAAQDDDGRPHIDVRV
jgi:hypothetical protein